MLSGARFDSGGSGRAILVAAAIPNGVAPISCTNSGAITLIYLDAAGVALNWVDGERV